MLKLATFPTPQLWNYCCKFFSAVGNVAIFILSEGPVLQHRTHDVCMTQMFWISIVYVDVVKHESNAYSARSCIHCHTVNIWSSILRNGCDVYVSCCTLLVYLNSITSVSLRTKPKQFESAKLAGIFQQTLWFDYIWRQSIQPMVVGLYLIGFYCGYYET